MADDAEDIISLGGTPEPESKALIPSPPIEQIHSTIDVDAAQEPTALAPPLSTSSQEIAANPSLNALSLSIMLEERSAAATLLAEKVSYLCSADSCLVVLIY
jgi:hypothetical protein